jgi:hypothetical protein
VTHPCNPSFSGSRDQEDREDRGDRGSKPSWANSSAKPYLEKTLHKNRAGGVAPTPGFKVKVLSESPSTTKRKIQIAKRSLEPFFFCADHKRATS